MDNERGFTLMEVLIALSILALALPILLGLRNFDLDLHARAKELTTATILAQEKLAETELGAGIATDSRDHQPPCELSMEAHCLPHAVADGAGSEGSSHLAERRNGRDGRGEYLCLLSQLTGIRGDRQPSFLLAERAR